MSMSSTSTTSLRRCFAIESTFLLEESCALAHANEETRAFGFLSNMCVGQYGLCMLLHMSQGGVFIQMVEPLPNVASFHFGSQLFAAKGTA